MAADPATIDTLVAALRQSRKYRHLCDDILIWAASMALEREPRPKAAAKLAKRKLHQAFGSFVADRRGLLTALEVAHTAPDDATFERALTDAILRHASTSERRRDPGAFWACVRDHVPTIGRILDLGCGVAPATLPWSGLANDVRYTGVDLDAELGEALQRALRPRYPNVRIETADVRRSEPWPAADVAILAKLVPTLERQAAGSGRALVDRLQADVVVATFPTRSLGGQDRGMAERYTILADQVLGPGITMTLPGELVRIVRPLAC